MAVLDTMTPNSRESKKTNQLVNQNKHDLHFDHIDNNGEEEITVLLIAINHSTTVSTAYVINSMTMSTINHPISIDDSLHFHFFLKIYSN